MIIIKNTKSGEHIRLSENTWDIVVEVLTNVWGSYDGDDSIIKSITKKRLLTNIEKI